jgi:hypothetical protein
LTLKKQFERAFQENAKGTLDYLMVGTFNEHVAQPQPNNFNKAGQVQGEEKRRVGLNREECGVCCAVCGSLAAFYRLLRSTLI